MDLGLPLARYRFEVYANTPIVFSDYSGSAWRGVFGHSLRELVCVTRQRTCEGCLLKENCVYVSIFETQPPANSPYMSRSTTAPHPFILSPPADLRKIPAGGAATFDLVLVGDSVAQLPYIVHSFERAGKRGLGAMKGRFQVLGIEQETSIGSNEWSPIYEQGQLRPLAAEVPEIPSLPNTITLDFTTPLRVRHRGKIMGTDNFSLAGVVANLLRRVSLLSYFQGAGELELDFRGLIDRAAGIQPVANTLHWSNWSRYSSRQQKRIRMGGLVGQVEYLGEGIAEYWPLLWLGQWLHAGKGTSMGLGAYRVSHQSLAEALVGQRQRQPQFAP